MSNPERLRLFISYAHKDGATLAQRLQADLAAQGFDAWLDTQRIAGGATWTTEIEQAVDACQVELALLTPGSYVSEICRAEQLRALRKGKRIIPLLAQSGSDIPLHLETKQYRDFTDPASYPERLNQLLEDVRTGAGVALKEEFRVTRLTYVTVPPTVTNYVDRLEALRALRDALFAESSRQPIALTALAGMGGIGKTVLAQGLARDETIQQAFPDGVVWITVGKEPKYDLVAVMHEIGKAFGDGLARCDNELACLDQYRTLMAQKAVLLVVDDVWRKTDLDPFLAESPRSRLLFTTRDAAIGRFMGAQEHTAELMDMEKSRELLAAWAGSKPEQLPPMADEVIAECGRLPLALSVIGALLRDAGPEVWSDTLDLLRKADLTGIAEQLPPGQESFFKAVEVSFNALDSVTKERYKELAVLLEDMAAPLPVFQTLWNVGEAEARRIGRYLADRSLAHQDAPSGSIRLHDLQLDYVRAQYPHQDALELIRGAVRLSSHVIERDPRQFASQMVGRLLPYTEPEPASMGRMPMPPHQVEQFVKSVTRGAPKPWLRLLEPALDPPGTALIRTLAGHTDGVNGVAMSADGRRAVSASMDNTLKVWDLESGRELHTLAGHSDEVRGVAMSADGRRAVSASSDTTLKVWDLESGRELRTLAGHSRVVCGVAVSGDGRRAVSASGDKTLKVWELESGRELRTLAGHSRVVCGVAVSADGRRAVSASLDKTLKVWDLESGRKLRTLVGHSDRVEGVAMSGDGRRAVSASMDNTLKVWDLESGRELHTLAGHSGSVYGVAVSADGRRAVSASFDETLKVWDLESGRELRTLAGHFSVARGVAVSGDGRRAVSASWDTTLKVWDLETGRELRTLAGHSAEVTGVAVSGDGRRAVSASADQTLKVWDLESGRELRTLSGHWVGVNGVAVSGDGRRAVSASADQTLKVWDLERGRELRTLAGHGGVVFAVAVSGDGRRAVSASEDKTLKVWDLRSGRELRTLAGHSDWVLGVAASGDGRRAVSASEDGTLKVWDLESGRELRTLAGHSSFVSSVAVSGDGRRAVSASFDKTLKVWDLESGRELRTLAGHSDRVRGVAVSADGQRVVSASSDKTLKVWDLETGALVTTFTCDAAARCCAFAGARRIVAGDMGGRVYFLSLELKEDN